MCRSFAIWMTVIWFFCPSIYIFLTNPFSTMAGLTLLSQLMFYNLRKQSWLDELFYFLLWMQLLWAEFVWLDQRMYPPSRKDFISLTLTDPHSHTYNNGKHRRQSCWRVSGPVVQCADHGSRQMYHSDTGTLCLMQYNELVFNSCVTSLLYHRVMVDGSGGRHG